MTTQTIPHDKRWQEIITIWRDNRWLFVVAGILIGVLLAPAIEQITGDLNALIGNLVPEALGIVFTVLILDKLADNRAKAELRNRLLNEVRSPSSGTAVTALDWLRRETWIDDHTFKGQSMINVNWEGAYVGDLNLEAAMFAKANFKDVINVKIVDEDEEVHPVNLQKANLFQANLSDALLVETNLTNANLYEANLTNADLHHADLTNANLQYANLTNADLHHANLSDAALFHANLTNANLYEANLTNANLYKTNLTNANLRYTNLTNANLWHADLTDADLSHANLSDAYLGEANLSDAKLRDAKLRDANLTHANLTHANLFKANLTNTKLWQANLTNTNLQEANLTHADLFKANLTDTKLWQANLTNADLQEANLTNTYLFKANLKGANLKNTQFDEKTVLPDAEFAMDEYGNRLVDDNEELVYTKYWTPETDMTRYTNPEHPEFWQPDWVKEQDKSSE